MPDSSDSKETPSNDPVVPDYQGRDITVGDIVRSLNGEVTGTIKEIAIEDGEPFVRIRPDHQIGSKGVWHAASRVVFAKHGRKR
ncbi:MAG: hypothetical protein AAF797_08750 [Planctomycetota bacterium]